MAKSWGRKHKKKSNSMDSRYPRVILAKGKNLVGSRPRLPAAERNNFRDVHRRVGQ